MPHALKNRDIIAISDLSKTEILEVLSEAKKLKQTPAPHLLEDYVLGACFFEPSTRTRLSFETAMQRLGGRVVGFADANVTSTKKGETLHDSIKIISQYVDIVAMRHPQSGSAKIAADASAVPIINGGDGANQHPTQTLLDLFTIEETQKTLDNLSIAMVGDLKNGRTVHSLAEALAHFNAKIYCVAPPNLQMPEETLALLKSKNISFSLHEKMEEVINEVDILYMTRVQGERFTDQAEYERIKHVYVLTTAHLANVRKNLKVLHPLPRVGEIAVDVDTTPYAYYFEQAGNGLFVREAILAMVLGKL